MASQIDDEATDTRPWYRTSPDETLERLDTEAVGLSDDEAEQRRGDHGPNRIQEQETISAWRVLIDQLLDPLIYVLLGALVVTVAVQTYADAIVVGIVLVINTTIGFVQEYRAQTAVQSLMKMVSPKATARRGGHEREVDAEALVPGDVLVLRQGEVVAADLRLLEATSLRVDESALTGESVPADKQIDAPEEEDLPPADQKNMAFMGTAVTAGEALGVVVRTGTDTEIGKISEQVQEASGTETPLEARIDRLAKWITVGVLGVTVVTFVLGLLLGRDVVDMLLLAVALAVSAIPAGLPVVVTVALAIGVSRMARRHALIRRLPAVDTLGSTTTIISDKTGTLTENRMTVQAVVSGGERFDVEGGEGGRRTLSHRDGAVSLDEEPALYETLLVGLLCNDATLRDDGDGDGGDDDHALATGDPMEVALLTVARAAGLDRDELLQRHPQRAKVPFQTERRYMATIHDGPEGAGEAPLVLVKGAPERIAEMCDRQRTRDGDEQPVDADQIIDTSEQLASQGLRVLAMAVGHGEEAAEAIRGDEPDALVFVGLQGLLDPPRDSAVGAVDRCHDSGIRVVMVTGDHATTAAAIARQIHLDRPAARPGEAEAVTAGETDADSIDVRTGQDLAALSDDEVDDALARINVFARVAPAQKLRLVDRLKSQDEIVAVTGDGVNDAPALQSAHLGVAMGSGTDVAKEASDMVITDDDFASVYAAVEEGRTAFRNIRMATFFLLSSGVAEVLLILATLALDWPLPLLPAQILWLNVVTNGIADVALAFEPGEPALFRRAPRPTGEGVLDRRLVERLVVVGMWLAAGGLAVFYWQWEVQGASLVATQTTLLTTLVLFEKVHVFNCRSEDVSVFSKSLLANKVLLGGVLASLSVHVAALYLPWTQQLLRVEPLTATSWLVAVGFAFTAVLVNEGHKRLRPRVEQPRVGTSDGTPQSSTWSSA
ncbi:MAG: HAD-IC family P-type ATPase [Acidimicrobiales bacterium]|nr:HAD-IC family P-type ATPase [Acidimicrobiales bacterium]